MHTAPRVPAPLAFVAGPAYNASVRIRNFLYDLSVLPRRRLRNPVISIGNITTGGTGKTPLVIFTAEKFTEMGYIPVILSRGYGRSNPNVPLIIQPGTKLSSPAREIGDEPALIRRRVPEAWFGLSKDRFFIGSRIERNSIRIVFILDDGFQHRRLRRDLDIVIIDSSQPLGSNRLLPGGTLREPLSGLSRSDAVVLNSAQNTEPTVDSVSSDIGRLLQESDLFQCEQPIEKLMPFPSWINDDRQEPCVPLIESAFLVAALGNPTRFQRDVRKLGIRISGYSFFKDHYRLRPRQWQGCVQSARAAGAEAIIVTEKDAVKIEEPPDFPLLVAVQNTRFSNEDAFVKLLCRCTPTRMNG